eukprot:9070784-Ditylum_brightwellii.AAC.1
MDTALSKLPLNCQVHVIKFMHNWLPVHAQSKKFNKTVSDLCPYCLTCSEMWEDLFQCTNGKATCSRSAALSQFQADLYRLKTATIIKTTILHHIAKWCKISLPPVSLPDDSVGQCTQATVEEQSELGWDNFLKGRMTKTWCNCQAHYHQESSSLTTEFESNVWKKGLIQVEVLQRNLEILL